MLMSERQAPVEVLTGCCLEKFYCHNGCWAQLVFLMDNQFWLNLLEKHRAKHLNGIQLIFLF